MNGFMKMLRHLASLEILLVYALLLGVSVALQSIGNNKFFLNELNYLSAPYYDFKAVAKALVYLVSYAISIGFIFLVTIQRSTKLWLIFLVYILVTYFIDIVSQLIGNHGFTHFTYALFLSEANNVKNLVVFLPEISKGVLITGLLLAALLGVRRFVKIRVSPKWLFVAPFFFLPVVIAKLGVHYIAYASYSSPIKVPIIIANYHRTAVDQPPRVLAQNVVPGNNLTDTIILIIDESISGAHLSINGYDRKTTPDIEDFVKRGSIVNYGVVNSGANCSALSQLTLRVGLSPYTEGAETNFVATRSSLPTIYQFAKRAGYKTWLIDTQVKQGTLTNHLTIDDLKFVDEYFTNPSRIEDYKRDRNGLDRVKDILKNDTSKKKLIVFVKDGAHWPYLWRFPKDREIFAPVQTTEYEPRIAENKEKLINTYTNVIRYAVNDFLKQYINEVDLNNTITFYTSDHGQAFLEPDAKDDLTHCSSFYDPSSSQVTVPLLVIEKQSTKRYIPEANKLYSQHQIFPSLLLEMGYADKEIKRYGNTLLNGYPKEHERWFYWSMEGDRSLYKPKMSL
ncbi:MAG: sulfatase-like hydrolase/transferase [Sideroxyarcus sp.]|nr:sulfatase-like hydrolase/transferase [Sideroxyarcus sp.]